MTEKIIHISDYSYSLPEDRIAKYPLEKRDQSKLLIFDKQKTIHTSPFYQIAEHLPTDCLLVFNNTRVIQARIEFRKETGSRIEIFCLKPFQPTDYQIIFASKQTCAWSCMIGNLKKWKDELLEMKVFVAGKSVSITASKSGIDENNNTIVKFNWDSEHTFAEILEYIGRIPIPPYLNRNSEEIDDTRYQTVYSTIKGSVAAPTAGLHFTPEVLKSLTDKQIKTCELTLHVGAGTFQPVKAENAREHSMHGELLIIDQQLIGKLLANLGNIVATGTTSLRSLESLYWLGVKIISGLEPNFLKQWEWEELDNKITIVESLTAIMEYITKQNGIPLQATTEIMIVPGYQFKLVNLLITNFHQPNSTLLLLIAAFIGEDWRKVYKYAMDNDYRFLSYGDSSLLIRTS